jgi:hypothetical protein
LLAGGALLCPLGHALLGAFLRGAGFLAGCFHFGGGISADLGELGAQPIQGLLCCSAVFGVFVVLAR